MNCKKCGSPLSPEDKFCKNCGTLVENNDISTNQNTNVVTPLPTETPSSTPNQQVNVKKNDKIFLIGGIALIAIIVLVVVMVIAPKFLGKSKNDSNNSTSKTTTTPAPSPMTSTSFYKVNFEDFTFKIPDNIVYEVNGDELLLSDEDGTWVTEVYVMQGSFNQIKNNKSRLQSYFQSNGFSSKAAEVKNISGTEFVTVELASGGISAIGAYAKLNSMYSVWTVTYDQDNGYDYNILKNVASVISSATYNDVSSSIKPEDKFSFNMNEISSLAQ